METGGAEKICTLLVNNLNPEKYHPYILCLKNVGENLKNLNANITVIDLNSPSIHYSIIKIYKVIKAHKPDIVVSWMGYINAYMGFFIPLFSKKIKWFCRESTIPSLMNKQLRLTSLFNFYYKFYNRFHTIICQSEYMKNDLINSFKVKEEKIVVINNPVDLPFFNEGVPDISAVELRRKFSLLYVGGLRKIKRIELLVQVMDLLPEYYNLTIVGNGEQQEDIDNLIKEKQLIDRIKIINGCYNPYPYYYSSNVLLLCSEFEGFPNVVIEAFGCGCPAIGYNIKGGANELLQNYGGFIVTSNKLSDFADKIITVCENTEIDHKKIKENSSEKFDLKRIIPRYEKLFK